MTTVGDSPGSRRIRMTPVIGRLSVFFRYAWGIGGLAPSFAGRVKIVVAACWLLARVYAPGLPQVAVRVPVLRRGRRLSLTLGQYQDLEIVRELYVEGEYPDDLELSDPEVIVDLGANIGLALLDFRLRYPHARLIGIEPDPIAFNTLASNTSSDPNIQILPVAAAGVDGVRTFYSSSESVVSGFSRSRPFQKPILVSTKSLDSLLGDMNLDGIDLLKIDVEGAEEEVLGACTRLSDVRVVVGELHTQALTMPVEDFYRRYLSDFAVETTDRRPERCTFVARQTSPPSSAA
jgi:FkbM family methyltransferase